MKLSQEDQKMIEGLRKQELNWRRGRWMMLFVGLVCLGLSVAGFVIVIPFLQRAADAKTVSESTVAAAFMLALFYPPALAFSGIGIAALCRSVRDWRGDAARILLLRLVDDRSRGDDHDA
jgi:hypothetical protein